MAPIMAKKGAVSVEAYAGDAKTLLAFNLEGKAARKHLASFTLQVTPPGTEAYYAYNNLHFERKAFVRRFDLHAPIQPKSHDLIFDTSQLAGGGERPRAKLHVRRRISVARIYRARRGT